MKSNKKTGKNRLDKYYHLAKEHGYRSRSAFKIIQLSKKFNIFQNCNVLVDLCAAPGGWLQVASKQLPVSSTIIGVDLVPIKPIKGVITFQSDIRTPKCRSLIMSQLKGSEVDVVLHDGSPNMGCNWNLDAFNQNTLVLSAAKLACSILRKGGIFVTKVFRSSDYNSLVWMLGNCFDKIKVTKPQSSRNVSAEIFAICIGFKSLKGLDPRLFNVEYVFHTDRENKKVTDDKQNKSLNQLFKELKKTNREGYEEGSIYSEISVLDFLRSDTPASLLVNNNKLLFDIPKKSKDTKDIKNKTNTNYTNNTENAKTNKEETKDTTDIKDLDSTESYEQDKELIQLVESDPLTTEEVKLLCSDLKVGGKSDLQSLLKWRFKLLKAYPSLDRKNNKKEKENKEKEQNEEETKENIELELDEEDKKIKDMIQHEKRKNERKQRKMMKKIKKGSTTESCSYLGPDPELFNLELLKRIEKEDEEEDDSEEEEEEGDNEKEAKDNRELDEDEEDNETETESDEDNEYYDDMDDELEFEDEEETDESDTEDEEDDSDLDEQEDNIEDPDFRRLMKMDVDLEVRHNIDKINESERPKNKKLTKREKSNLDKSTEMKQFLERMQYEAKMEAEREEDDEEEEEDKEEEDGDEEMEDRDDVETEESESEDEQDEEDEEEQEDSDQELESENDEDDEKEEQEEYNEEEGDIISSRWFDQEIFDPNVEKESIKEKGKKKKRDRKNKKEDEDKDKEGFQVVPAISNSEIKELVKNEDFSDLSNDQDAVAHVQALGSLLINKKTRMELIDGAYNKKTFMDENLPSWFVDDENKHNKREYPVSKELMKKYKAKLIELKKRPIKKVLEAQHRKAMRAKKRFKSILPKIEAISSDVNSTGNANKLLRGLKKIKSTKRDKVYVISRKTGSKKISKTHNVGSRKVYKPVDRRMKKDNRRSKVKHKKKSRKARIH